MRGRAESAVAGCGQGADRAREDLLSGITPGKQLRLKKTGARTPYAATANSFLPFFATDAGAWFSTHCRPKLIRCLAGAARLRRSLATPSPPAPAPPAGWAARKYEIWTGNQENLTDILRYFGTFDGYFGQCSAAAIAAGLKERFAHVRNAETPATVSEPGRGKRHDRG